ncbi:MAG: glycoside hydrolase family 43 protein [Chloroflexi bacterium]|nr:glycoside hydrolase family 43 protein [Chloroflexota bacterium]
MPSTYTNPVYPYYIADPFVLRHDGHYYAYGTAAPSADGWQFPVLHSPDLVHWEAAGYALPPIPGADQYWAPEVAFHDGRFYLYFSARGLDDRDHQLRVAVSDQPTGPFLDRDVVLTPDDPFTIDPHPFHDSDGQWYLFYARDFLTLDGEYRVGTGIVVDKLIDMETLAGDPQVVVRPHADWHLFQSERSMYGAVYEWHTIEGAAVRRHNGRYYCFYSGGAWERENYGVAYVVADHPLGPYHRPPEAATPLLKSVPGQVIGPGHNSFTTAPDGQEIVVYHGWDVERTARLMRIDRLTWDGDTPVLHAPTFTPQPIPWLK